MSLPFNRRSYDLFLSHAHKDRQFVERLHGWLSQVAHIKVWYDRRDLAPGSFVATDLQAAIEDCRGIVVVASKTSLAHDWVKAEYNSGVAQRSKHGAFRVVALRVGGADVGALMDGVSWIEMPAEQLDADGAFGIVHALYPSERRPPPRGARDVYVSCSWHTEDDDTSTRTVCRNLIDQGFRLIGDAQDNKLFGEGDRVERIMSSCGAFVAIVPYRNSGDANAQDKPYKYFIREIDLATKLGLESVVIADPRVRRTDGSDASWVRMPADADGCSSEVRAALGSLWQDWQEPRRPHYIFFAVDLASDAAREGSSIRHMIETVTGLPTIVGTEVEREGLHSAFVDTIANAVLVVADITGDNLNTCIEAGIALGARTKVLLLAQGETRSPPFMLRGLQLRTYESDVERIGVLHRILRPYRRRILNAEF